MNLKEGDYFYFNHVKHSVLRVDKIINKEVFYTYVESAWSHYIGLQFTCPIEHMDGIVYSKKHNSPLWKVMNE